MGLVGLDMYLLKFVLFVVVLIRFSLWLVCSISGVGWMW